VHCFLPKALPLRRLEGHDQFGRRGEMHLVNGDSASRMVSSRVSLPQTEDRNVTHSGKTTHRLRYFEAIALFAALCACAPQAQTGSVAIPKIPPGMARAWFYREDLPYNGLDRPYIRMNSAIVGISELGGAFYRDVSPGAYYVKVDTYRHFINQFPHVDLMPGETLYFQVFEWGSLSSGVGASTNYARPTFYIWVMPAAVAEPAVAHSLFYAGGG
jgi:hypothetical protein